MAQTFAPARPSPAREVDAATNTHHMMMLIVVLALSQTLMAGRYCDCSCSTCDEGTYHCRNEGRGCHM